MSKTPLKIILTINGKPATDEEVIKYLDAKDKQSKPA